MNIETQPSRPVVDGICARLWSAPWALRVSCAIAVLVPWPLAGHAQSVTATVTVGTAPDAVAVNPVTNKIYVANDLVDNSVTVIDGATNATTTFFVGTAPVAVAVNPVTNKIYVTNQGSNSVTVIDGATNTTTTVTNANASGPRAVAVNPVTNKIYVANGGTTAIPGATVTVIDAANNNAVSTVTVGTGPFAVAVNPATNKIYVTNIGTTTTFGTTVTVIDGANNNVIATVTVGTVPVALAVNPATNKIYVANAGTSTTFGTTVTVIDGATNVPTTVAAGARPFAVAVNPVTNKIYVANTGDGFTPSTVTVIDGATNTPATVNAGIGPSHVAVNPLTNKIYVTNQGSTNPGTVTIIDGATNATMTLGAEFQPMAVAVNPVTNKIYVANLGSVSVTVIDGATNTLATVSVAVNPGAVAVNPATNKIYVNTNAGSSVTVIDGATNATMTISGVSAGVMAVNPVTNKIYLAQGIDIFSPSTITVIDGATNLFTTFTDTNAHAPSGIAVNAVTNKIYVANLSGSLSPATVTVIDGATNNFTDVINPSGVSRLGGIDVNPVTNKIYVGNCDNPGTVTVIDGSTNATTTVAVGIDPTSVAVNPVTNRIYVANRGTAVTPSSVSVIDGATNATITTLTIPGAGAMAVNPVTNKIYVASNTAVTVIDGATNNTTTVPLAQVVNTLVVNPVTNEIYLTSINSTNVTVIDGATNTTTTVAAGTSPLGIAVNPVTNKIYIGNNGSSNVTVVTEAQVQPNPLNTAITPLAGNTTTSAAQMFQFAAANTTANAPPVTNLYFQFDTFEGAWSQGTASGVAGSFVGAASGLSVGTHILYAFAADGEEATSVMQASSPIIGGITAYLFEEQGISTSTTLTADLNPSIVGQGVTFTAAVFSSASGTPSGSASFFDGSTFVGNVALDNTGHAAFATSSLTAGLHSITVVYFPSSSAGFAASTSTAVSESVLRATSTALTPSANPVTFGQPLTFTATVSPNTGSGTPTGTVTFLDGTTLIGTGALNGSAQATFSISSLAGGAHFISAKYSGDTNFGSSTSAAVNETVQTAATSTALTASANPVTTGQQVTFTATVSKAAGSIGTPTGMVTFKDGSTVLGTGALNASGIAAFATSSLAAGSHSIAAVYGGDANFAASTSTALTETINAPLDFSIGVAAGGSTSATIKAGQTAMYTLQFSLVGGAATDQLMLNVSCTGAPPKATCSGPASPVTVTQAAPATVAVSVATTANALLIPPGPSSRLRTPWNPLPILWVLPVLLMFLWLRRHKHTEACAWAVRPAFAAPILLLAVLGAGMSGCGGGGQPPPPPPINGTPPGTYTLTVTVATSSNLTHTEQLTLMVQ